MKNNRNIALILLIITAGILILRIILAFRGYYLEQVSGSWAALAVDASKGILYRPLFDETLGTGGTRWMPLFFTLHGILIKITGNALYTGLLLSLFSSMILLLAVALLLKYYKTSLESSLVIITLLIISNNLLTAMTAVRGDILAAALNIWGLYFAITSGKRHYRVILASLFFALTLMTKITSGFGFAAVFLWLFFNDKKKQAAGYAISFVFFFSLFIIVIQVLSSGRFFEIFFNCAAGGATFIKFMKIPFNFIRCLAGTDQGSLIILTAALSIIAHKGRDIAKSQYALYMVSTLAITMFIFGTEGIVGNHLIDLHIASVLVIAAFIQEYKIETGIVVRCSIIVITIACVLNAHSLRQDIKSTPLFESIKHTSELVKNETAMISQNPWLPIIMKRDVYMLDPWMMRLIDKNRPEMLTSFHNRLKEKGFSCIIFDKDPLVPPSWMPDWFENAHFGRKFMAHVFMHYRFRENHDNYYIYIPTSQPGSR